MEAKEPKGPKHPQPDNKAPKQTQRRSCCTENPKNHTPPPKRTHSCGLAGIVKKGETGAIIQRCSQCILSLKNLAGSVGESSSSGDGHAETARSRLEA